MSDFRLATYYAWWANLSATAARDLAAHGHHDDAYRYAQAAQVNRRRYIQVMGR